MTTWLPDGAVQKELGLTIMSLNSYTTLKDTKFEPITYQLCWSRLQRFLFKL